MNYIFELTDAKMSVCLQWPTLQHDPRARINSCLTPITYQADTFITALPGNLPCFSISQNLSTSSRVPFVRIGWTRPLAVKSSLATESAQHSSFAHTKAKDTTYASSTSFKVPVTLPTTFRRFIASWIGGAPATTLGSAGSPTATTVPPGLRNPGAAA